MRKFICSICGYVYDETKENLKWDELPANWKCPLCGASKSDFREETSAVKSEVFAKAEPIDDEMKELSSGELSILCSNLARGCEKQYLAEQSALFTQLADYYQAKTADVPTKNFEDLLIKINKDFEVGFVNANQAAVDSSDRGAKRALTWSEKVTRMLNSLITRYEQLGDKVLEDTSIYVCEICGFIYVGDKLPEICPVCKVPNMKILKIERSL
ncbi:MAG: rubredoxin [Christensenellaceae bacterium]